MPAIAIRHLSKTFEQKGNSVEALRDISLDIEEGDIYGIIGMSGAGKSTLVRCLNYLERPTSGEVIIGGRDLGTLTEKELREQRSDIAMIFQHFNLLMQKSVLDNVCFPMQIAKKKKDEAKKRALEGETLLAQMDLIADYPERAMAYIGLFMMEASVQQAGIGTRIVEDLCRHLAEEGIRTVRLCWVKGNPQAEHFWRKNQFAPIRETQSMSGQTVVLAERRLK